jgi:hypothetical protein
MEDEEDAFIARIENGTIPRDYSPLHTYVNKPRVLKALLDRGDDVNKKDIDGYTPLMHAASIGNLESVRLLLDRGADPRATKGLARYWAWHYASNSIRLLLLSRGGLPPDSRMRYDELQPHVAMLALLVPVDVPRARKTPWLPRDLIRGLFDFLARPEGNGATPGGE